MNRKLCEISHIPVQSDFFNFNLMKSHLIYSLCMWELEMNKKKQKNDNKFIHYIVTSRGGNYALPTHKLCPHSCPALLLRQAQKCIDFWSLQFTFLGSSGHPEAYSESCSETCSKSCSESCSELGNISHQKWQETIEHEDLSWSLTCVHMHKMSWKL